ncbi:lathosterol oxidase-like isoform 2-T3 [Vipera latastei]
MDLILDYADTYILTPYVYPATWPEDNAFRQIISLSVITYLGAFAVYFLFGSLSYYLLFDHKLKKHPQFLENQVQREIKLSLSAIVWISTPTVATFFAEVRGYGKLYSNIEDSSYGWFGVVFSIFSFLFFTDMCIYWIHRFVHHKLLYKRLHKPHHMWKIPTPFASHAVHPLDGLLHSLPYHIYPFLFPVHKVVYLGLIVLGSIWSSSIHDADYRVPNLLKPIINGAAHQTLHHLFFNYNYSQYFTLWDRIGGSYKNPSSFEGEGLHAYLKKVADGPEEEKLQGGDEVKNK